MLFQSANFAKRRILFWASLFMVMVVAHPMAQASTAAVTQVTKTTLNRQQSGNSDPTGRISGANRCAPGHRG